MSTRLTCLGTGSILQCRDRNPAGYLLESEQLGDGLVLLDAGPGTLRRLAELEVDTARIRHVLLSHYHLDHHVDLLGLLFQRRNPELRARAESLQIHGPRGFVRIYERWSQAYGNWVAEENLLIRELGQGEHELEEGIALHAFANQHSAAGFCYRIELGGRVLAYSGDTEGCAGLNAACRDADFALVECSFPDELRQKGHLSPRDIRALIALSSPKRIGLTHFYPEMAQIADDPEQWARLWHGVQPTPVALRDRETIEL
jgi:ribonuclease BN (tRNA processing enzyme)